MKLTRNGKLFFTLLTMIFSMMVYSFVSIPFVIETKTKVLLYALGWTWLFIGQTTIYYLIWRED